MIYRQSVNWSLDYILSHYTSFDLFTFYIIFGSNFKCFYSYWQKRIHHFSLNFIFLISYEIEYYFKLFFFEYSSLLFSELLSMYTVYLLTRLVILYLCLLKSAFNMNSLKYVLIDSIFYQLNRFLILTSMWHVIFPFHFDFPSLFFFFSHLSAITIKFFKICFVCFAYMDSSIVFLLVQWLYVLDIHIDI